MEKVRTGFVLYSHECALVRIAAAEGKKETAAGGGGNGRRKQEIEREERRANARFLKRECVQRLKMRPPQPPVSGTLKVHDRRMCFCNVIIEAHSHRAPISADWTQLVPCRVPSCIISSFSRGHRLKHHTAFGGVDVSEGTVEPHRSLENFAVRIKCHPALGVVDQVHSLVPREREREGRGEGKREGTSEKERQEKERARVSERGGVAATQSVTKEEKKNDCGRTTSDHRPE